MSFASQIGVFIKKARKETEEEFRVRTFQFWVDVVTLTPRITGALRANWQFGNGSDNDKTFGANAEGSAKARAKKKNNELKLTETAVIFNNLEYAKPVNDGLGKGHREPRRMVEQAIELSKSRTSVGR